MTQVDPDVRTLFLADASNATCADCRCAASTHVNVSVGAYVCETCSFYHQHTLNHVVKSLQGSRWSNQDFVHLRTGGNYNVNSSYEKCLPKSVERPSEYSAPILLKHFIESKYTRLDWSDEAHLPVYYKGLHAGSLEKRNKLEDKWVTYHFSIKGYTLEFSTDDQENVGAIKKVDLTEANVVVSPKCLARAKRCSFVLTFYEDNEVDKFRSIFVAGQSGLQIWQWYCAIRAAKLQAMTSKHPHIPVDVLAGQLTHDFLTEGFLFKSDPREDPAHLQRRWCVLDDRQLHYYNMPLDPYPKGSIYVGFRGSLAHSTQDRRDLGHVIQLTTPTRKFFLKAESHSEKMEWLNLFRFVQDSPLNNLAEVARRRDGKASAKRMNTVLGIRRRKSKGEEDGGPAFHVSVRTSEDSLNLTSIQFVYLRFGGKNWKGAKVCLPRQQSPDEPWAFGKGLTDVFAVEEDLGSGNAGDEIESVDVWTDDSGDSPEWGLSSVQVIDWFKGQAHVFVNNQKIGGRFNVGVSEDSAVSLNKVMTLIRPSSTPTGRPKPSVHATAPKVFLHHVDSRRHFRLSSFKQKILRSQQVYDSVVDHLRPSDVLIDLVDAGFVDEEEQTRVLENSASFPVNSNSVLLYMLMRKDDAAFDAFVDSLRNHPTDLYRGMVAVIEETERRRAAAGSARPRGSTSSTTSSAAAAYFVAPRSASVDGQ